MDTFKVLHWKRPLPPLISNWLVFINETKDARIRMFILYTIPGRLKNEFNQKRSFENYFKICRKYATNRHQFTTFSF